MSGYMELQGHLICYLNMYLDKLLAREVSYQTFDKGVTAYLSEKNKRYWPNFPIHIGQYSLLNKRHVEKEAKTLKEICLCTRDKKGHDPKMWYMIT
jgi:hypothetical protein